LLPRDIIIDVIWLIFAISLYGIGYMGFKQKSINPTHEAADEEPEIIPVEIELNLSQELILQKILDEFEKEKIYLNPNLNITDIVQRVGTNRTYISSIINQQYKQNFCSFVNDFRITELEVIYKNNPHFSNEELAEHSGFGSVNSLRRVVVSKTGMSLKEWKHHKMSV
jgi:AraC-like DNA-binding protein